MLFSKEEAAELRVVKGCAVTRASTGVMEFSPELIAQIAGLARDKIEWMLLLLGEQSDDGYHVAVTGFRVPKQQRGGAHADMASAMEDDGSTIGPEVVGVMHLHPWWSQANFSNIDTEHLNPFFRSSIVVSPARNSLGFTYQAIGKALLPCGSTGQVPLVVAVTGSERFSAQVVKASDEKGGLGDCNRYEGVDVDYSTVFTAACGRVQTDERIAAFGMDGAALMAQIVAATVTGNTEGRGLPPSQFQGSTYYARDSEWCNTHKTWDRCAVTKDAAGATKPVTRRGRRRAKRQAKLSARREGLALAVRYQSGDPWECQECGCKTGTLYTEADGVEACEDCHKWLAEYDGKFRGGRGTKCDWCSESTNVTFVQDSGEQLCMECDEVAMRLGETRLAQINGRHEVGGVDDGSAAYTGLRCSRCRATADQAVLWIMDSCVLCTACKTADETTDGGVLQADGSITINLLEEVDEPDHRLGFSDDSRTDWQRAYDEQTERTNHEAMEVRVAADEARGEKGLFNQLFKGDKPSTALVPIEAGQYVEVKGQR